MAARKGEREQEAVAAGPAPEAAPASAPLAPAEQVLFLQRSAGNAAVTAALARSPVAAPVRPAGPVLARGEAGVHQDIEMDATGTQAPHLEQHLNGPVNMTPQQQAAMEMYSGNWMRDFSQFNVPAMFDIVAGLPRTPGRGGGGALGARGAESFINGLLQTLASIEFGDAIATRMMTGPNIGVYRPQEHMDNTMGMTMSGDVLTRERGALRAGGDASQVQGAAGLGAEVENQANYAISGAGLSQHIYNTTESVKGRLQTGIDLAANPATRPEGRMNIGAGLHGVEDYFSHSNFIEVALNILLQNRAAQPAQLRNLPASGQAGGGPVDTLYDQSVTVNGQARQAITTGTFTSRDTRVSIAHVLLPRLPSLFTTIDGAIDRAMFAMAAGESAWPAIQRQLQSDRAGQAFTHLIDGMQGAGMELPAPELLTWQVPDLPDVLPDDLETALEGRWIAYGIDHDRYLPPHDAFAAYSTLISQARQIWNFREEMTGAITAVLAALENIPLIGRIAAVAQMMMKLRQALALLRKTIDELIEEFRRQIKQRVREFMFSTIEQLTGVNVPSEKREVLDDWLAAIQTGVEELGHSSSLQVQRDEGSLNVPGASLPADPNAPLPPSHSEISKDHPAHADPHADPNDPHGGPVTGHAHDLESLFFEIHHELAVQADRHITQLVDEAIAARDPGAHLIGPGATTLGAGERRQRDAEATREAQAAQALAAAEHRRFAQAGVQSPQVRAVLNAVDLYISHPADTTWWRPVMQRMIDAEPEEVLRDIQRRNQTRAQRAPLASQGPIARGIAP